MTYSIRSAGSSVSGRRCCTPRPSCRGGRTDMNLTMDRDAPLLEALRLGEPTAAERLAGAYGDPVYRRASRIPGSEPAAEEGASDSLWSVVPSIATLRGEGKL